MQDTIDYVEVNKSEVDFKNFKSW